LLSPIEVWGDSFIDRWNAKDFNSSYTTHYYASEGNQYELYLSLGVTASNCDLLSSDSSSYLRSPAVSSNTNFLGIYYLGCWSSSNVSDLAMAVRAAFCL
jgi:hypothetical protein